ncbi:MAG: DNA-processing protein DprA [Tissierellia bacterium]|nr:DNA-processing protein DprA [Tissierellia bacterium]
MREIEREGLLWASMAGFQNGELLTLLAQMDDFMDFYEGGLSPEEGKLPPKIAKKLQERRRLDLTKMREILEEENIRPLLVGDDFYPEKLALTPDPPVVLYTLGDLALLEKKALSMVGARKYTAYGKRCCEGFARAMAAAGVVIISGMAMGIDSMAHNSALDVDGDTIAVLGSGIDTPYPKSNLSLYRKISARGLILSEYPPGTPPLPFRFPQRNRIIAALGDATLVVEGKLQSGSLITGRIAGELGREVFAICGNIDSVFSEGTNKLIQDGALMALKPQDLLEHPVFAVEKEEAQAQEWELDFTEAAVVQAVEEGAQNVDAIAEAVALSMDEILPVLSLLELKGVLSGVDSQSIQINRW